MLICATNCFWLATIDDTTNRQYYTTSLDQVNLLHSKNISLQERQQLLMSNVWSVDVRHKKQETELHMEELPKRDLMGHDGIKVYQKYKHDNI